MTESANKFTNYLNEHSDEFGWVGLAQVKECHANSEPVEIYENDEAGELQYSVHFQDLFACWLESFKTREDAVNWCTQMGLNLVEPTPEPEKEALSIFLVIREAFVYRTTEQEDRLLETGAGAGIQLEDLDEEIWCDL